jgi:threonine dehydratase
MVNLSDIQAARERLAQRVIFSPCTRFEDLSRITGADVYIKLENLQVTGSFKVRGALNALLQLDEPDKQLGIVAASAGNHAQAVAYGAQLLGISAAIVMPETTPLTKIEGTRAFGAEIVLAGQNYDAAYAKAVEIQQQSGRTLIHAFDHPHVIAGQGTIGLEILEQLPDVDLVIVPVGGGGLISGIAAALKTSRPQASIIGVEAKRLPAMQQSLAAKQIKALRPSHTLADGIAVAEVGHHTLPMVQRYVSDMVSVTDDEIARAVAYLLEREKTLAEGAGAVGIAALSNNYIRDVSGKKIVIVVSGGNIDMTQLRLILERGLESDQRLANLEVVAPDKASSIAELAVITARHQAKILSITSSHHPGEVELGEVELNLSLETKGRQHVTEIIAAITQAGFSVRPT